MRLQHILAVGFLALGLGMPPAFTTLVRADDTPKERPRGGPGGILKRIRSNIDKLNITDEQKPKIDAAFADAKTKIEAAVKEASGDRDAIRAKVGPIIKELMTTVAGILTPEQKVQLEKMRKERSAQTKPSN